MEPGSAGRGNVAKLKLNNVVEAKILAVLASHGSLNDAAKYVGVDRKTLHNWTKRDPGFSHRIDTAVLEGKLKLLKKVGKATAWQAAAWMLERKWWKEYAKREVPARHEDDRNPPVEKHPATGRVKAAPGTAPPDAQSGPIQDGASGETQRQDGMGEATTD